jgi:hypothetical protein
MAATALRDELATRTGAKAVLVAGLLGFAVAQLLFLRLPAAGTYTADLVPGFLIVAVTLMGRTTASAEPSLP